MFFRCYTLIDKNRDISTDYLRLNSSKGFNKCGKGSSFGVGFPLSSPSPYKYKPKKRFIIRKEVSL